MTSTSLLMFYCIAFVLRTLLLGSGTERAGRDGRDWSGISNSQTPSLWMTKYAHAVSCTGNKATTRWQGPHQYILYTSKDSSNKVVGFFFFHYGWDEWDSLEFPIHRFSNKMCNVHVIVPEQSRVQGPRVPRLQGRIDSSIPTSYIAPRVAVVLTSLNNVLLSIIFENDEYLTCFWNDLQKPSQDLQSSPSPSHIQGKRNCDDNYSEQDKPSMTSAKKIPTDFKLLHVVPVLYHFLFPLMSY